MSSSRYVENTILAADPLGLVRLLYEGAIDSLLQARGFLEQGKIAERSESISRAMQIVAELQTSLDLERGGEIAHSLAQLYAYVQERLVEANAHQTLPPLNEALNLLLVLHGGWKDITAEPTAAAPTDGAIAPGSPAAWTI